MTVTGPGGTVTPSGTTTQDANSDVTLTASWNDATHDFTGWTGDCAGTASTCVVTMDAARAVTATFAELPADPLRDHHGRGLHPRGLPGCARTITRRSPTSRPTNCSRRTSDGRYHVERGQQYTVVTAAQLPEGWTRFYLQRDPGPTFGVPSPVSFSQLIKPVGTTYTFTVNNDVEAATLITFDLKAARPFVRPRPDNKPEIGASVVTTVFSVETTSPRYSAYDTTGAVATAGSYALMTGSGDDEAAVTTYEALRDGTAARLRIHESDAHGASQTALYDTVETGHVIEWGEAGDCFVRYRVTDVPAVAATATYREFGVRAETYAWQSCQTGSLPAGASAVRFTAAPQLPLEELGGTNLTDFAIVHGVWQLMPYAQPSPGAPGSAPANISLLSVGNSDPGRQPDIADPIFAVTLSEARQLRYWREPELPAGWTLQRALSGDLGHPVWGYCAEWRDGDGYAAVEICGYYADVQRGRHATNWLTNHDPPRLIVREPIVVANRPGWVEYSPRGAQHHPSGSVAVAIYDAATETIYEVWGGHRTMRGANILPVIAIARSLFQGTNPP